MTKVLYVGTDAAAEDALRAADLEPVIARTTNDAIRAFHGGVDGILLGMEDGGELRRAVRDIHGQNNPAHPFVTVDTSLTEAIDHLRGQLVASVV